MIQMTGVTLITVLLIACASEGKQVSANPDSGVTPSASTSPSDSVVTTYGEDGKLLPDALRIKFDVDADGRVQNIQLLESTTTPEVERKIISKMKNEWRYEKGKPGTGLRIVIVKAHRILAHPPIGTK